MSRAICRVANCAAEMLGATNPAILYDVMIEHLPFSLTGPGFLRLKVSRLMTRIQLNLRWLRLSPPTATEAYTRRQKPTEVLMFTEYASSVENCIQFTSVGHCCTKDLASHSCRY